MSDTLIVAVLGFLGTMGGAYFANRKSSALIAYRLEQLEDKVNRHNQVIERTFQLEKQEAAIEEHLKSIDQELGRLGDYHKP